MKTKEVQFIIVCLVAILSLTGMVVALEGMTTFAVILNALALIGLGVFIYFSFNITKKFTFSAIPFYAMVLLNAILPFGVKEPTWSNPRVTVDTTFVKVWLAVAVIIFVSKVIIDVIDIDSKTSHLSVDNSR